MPLIWPLATPVLIVQDFCSWEWTHPHTALDLQAANGTTIIAIQDGTVSFVGDRGDGYGNTVEITHNQDNLLSKYSHMSSFLVSQDQVVTQGTPLGLSGHTGTGSGAHLHFALARLSDVSSYLWENGSSPGGFDPCSRMPNPAGGGFWDDNARAGPDSAVSGHSNAGCSQCPQVAPEDVTTGPFRSISSIAYSVTTSQSEAVSKDCIVAPEVNSGYSKSGVNHIVSVELVNPTGAAMNRSFEFVVPPSLLPGVRGFQDLGGGTVSIQSPASLAEVQAAFDAVLGAGNVVVTHAIGHHVNRGLLDG